MDLQELIKQYNHHRFEWIRAGEALVKAEADLKKSEAYIAAIDESMLYLNEAAKLTQDQLKDQVESLVTVAMDMVFDRHYDFQLRFSRSGGRLDCRAVLIDGDREMDDPEFDVGGSRVDTISIALRVVVWSLDDQQYRGLFVLDEPFTSLGNSELLDRTLEMIQQISKQLGIQIILITHIERAQAIADRAWTVTNDGTRSTIECTVGAPSGRIRA